MSAPPIEIPFEWHRYHHNPGYFVTYYGDIYHGKLINSPKFPDRFFILSNNQSQEFNALKSDEHTLENYQRLAWEIRDRNIIKFVIPQPELGVDGNRQLPSRPSQVWKKMFVFGAGASTHCLFGKNKDSEYDSMQLRPPLGCDIFDQKFAHISRKYEGALLSEPLFESTGRDIEACLEDEWIKLRNGYNPNIAVRHINLQFYLQTLFTRISSDVTTNHTRYNLYSLFANKLQTHLAGTNERVALVSFNYDTILDSFIERIFHINFKDMNDYIDYNRNPVLMFKPHGSCNWGWQIKHRQQLESQHPILHEALYEKKTELWDLYYRIMGDFNNMVHKLSWGNESSLHKHRLGRFTLNKNLIEVMEKPLAGTHFPALLMPYRDKDEFVMNYNQQDCMRWFISEVEELFLIGWKGNEDVFNRLLKDQAGRLKRIVIVNPLEGKNKEVSKHLSKQLMLSRYDIKTIDTFEEFVLKEIDNLFVSN